MKEAPATGTSWHTASPLSLLDPSSPQVPHPPTHQPPPHLPCLPMKKVCSRASTTRWTSSAARPTAPSRPGRAWPTTWRRPAAGRAEHAVRAAPRARLSTHLAHVLHGRPKSLVHRLLREQLKEVGPPSAQETLVERASITACHVCQGGGARWAWPRRSVRGRTAER